MKKLILIILLTALNKYSIGTTYNFANGTNLKINEIKAVGNSIYICGKGQSLFFDNNLNSGSSTSQSWDSAFIVKYTNNILSLNTGLPGNINSIAANGNDLFVAGQFDYGGSKTPVFSKIDQFGVWTNYFNPDTIGLGLVNNEGYKVLIHNGFIYTCGYYNRGTVNSYAYLYKFNTNMVLLDSLIIPNRRFCDIDTMGNYLIILNFGLPIITGGTLLTRVNINNFSSYTNLGTSYFYGSKPPEKSYLTHVGNTIYYRTYSNLGDSRLASFSFPNNGNTCDNSNDGLYSNGTNLYKFLRSKYYTVNTANICGNLDSTSTGINQLMCSTYDGNSLYFAGTSTNGNSGYFTSVSSIITDVEKADAVNELQIFPNPSNDNVTINFGNFEALTSYTLKITNALSQQVYLTQITQQSSYIDLSTWIGNGVYFVHLIDPQGNTADIRKIVLQ